MSNPNLFAEVSAAMDSTEDLLNDSLVQQAYFDIYKIQDKNSRNRSLLYLYRYGLNLWMGENGVNPVLPEDSVLRMLLRLEEVCIDHNLA